MVENSSGFDSYGQPFQASLDTTPQRTSYPRSSSQTNRNPSYGRLQHDKRTALGTDTDLIADIESIYGRSLGFIESMIIRSGTFKQAYSIFKSDVRYGEPYLAQLLAVPGSYSVGNETILDNLGLSSKYSDNVANVFNDAMAEIRQLISNYQSFVNGLPTEQFEQLAEAGYNAAVSGQGLDGSQMDTSGLLQESAPISNANTHEALNSGITSFVSFLSAVGNLGIASETLDIAQSGNIRAQEAHDLKLAQEGITTEDSSLVGTTADTIAEVAGKKVSAESSALSSNIKFNNRVMSGYDVLSDVTRFKMITQFGQSFYDSVVAQKEAYYSDALSILELDERASGLHAQISENDFNTEFYRARNGQTEGMNTSRITEIQKNIYELDEELKGFTAWINDYKQSFMESWGEQLEDKPHLAPFMFKAVFDFDMTDTFNNMTSGRQWWNAYGGNIMNFAGDFLRGVMKRKGKPVPPKAKSSINTLKQ